jgi:phosphoglycerate-specific signal transduction histidine kinase
MFESVFLQAAGSTTVPTASESLSGLINAISLLVGAVVPLIISVLTYVKASSHDPQIKKALDTGVAVGRIATATAKKAVENKENIKSLIDVGLKIAPPQAQQAIEEQKTLMNKVTQEIEATNAQISQLRPSVPPEADADTIANLPREKDFQ